MGNCTKITLRIHMYKQNNSLLSLLNAYIKVSEKFCKGQEITNVKKHE